MPSSNGSFVIPFTASEGIHDTDTTDDVTRMGAPYGWTGPIGRRAAGVRRVGLAPPRSAWSSPVDDRRALAEWPMMSSTGGSMSRSTRLRIAALALAGLTFVAACG